MIMAFPNFQDFLNSLKLGVTKFMGSNFRYEGTQRRQKRSILVFN